MLALLVVVLAEVLGTEMMLGAFMAGVVVSVLPGSGGKVLREKLDVIGYGFLVPIFFIMVGAQLGLSVLVGSSAGSDTMIIDGDVLTLMAEPLVVGQTGMLESLCSDDVCFFEFMG